MRPALWAATALFALVGAVLTIQGCMRVDPPPAPLASPPLPPHDPMLEPVRYVPPPPPAPPEPRGYWMTVRATAYSPHDPHDSHYRSTKGAKWVHITADGTTDVRRVPHGIAVPLNARRRPILAYGTLVTIPAEYDYPLPQVRVDDTGSGIRTKTRRTGVTYIDLRFPTHADALTWAGPKGYRELRIFIHE